MADYYMRSRQVGRRIAAARQTAGLSAAEFAYFSPAAPHMEQVAPGRSKQPRIPVRTATLAMPNGSVPARRHSSCATRSGSLAR
jgi:hypothetical protein